MPDWYTGGLVPATGSPGQSSPIRAQFASIASSFAKMPELAGKGGFLVQVNSGGTALESVSMTNNEPLRSAINTWTDTTNNASTSFVLTHATTLTPAIGIGTAVAFRTETAADVYTLGGYVGVAASDLTGAAETFAMNFATKIAGVEAIRAQITSGGNFNLSSGYTYQINGSTVLSATVLGSSVLASSLTSLGTIASLVATTADINAGTVDNTVIGASTPAAGTFTTLSASTSIATNGSTWNSTGLNLASGDVFQIAGNTVLSATALGSGVVSSSLTSVGTIATGVWQGTAINQSYVVGLSGTNSGDNVQATTSQIGIVTMATSAETTTGTSTTKVVTPDALSNADVKARSIKSDTLAGQVKIDILSQAAYDAIVTKDASTLYFIV